MNQKRLKRPVLYSIANLLLKYIIAPILLDIKIEGKEKVPNHHFIVAGNHFNWSDPVLLSLLTNRTIYFIGKAELFRNPLIGWLMRSLACFPVERGQPDRQALKEALRVVNQNEILGIFPEGTRSKTGELGPFEPGAAFIAMKTGAPILPVGIIGTYKVGILSFFFPKKHKFKLRVGDLIRVPQGVSLKEGVEKLTLELDQAIRELITDGN